MKLNTHKLLSKNGSSYPLSVVLSVSNSMAQCEYSDRLVLFLCCDECITCFNIQKC